jgi:glycosyltransferase involved in cell wall biosynthesis
MVHIGDDVGTLSKVPREELNLIYKGAAVRVAISHEMKLEYEKRFGVPFDVLHNGAADELFVDHAWDGAKNDAFVIRYIGSLLRAQHWNSIEDIVEAVHELNRRGISMRFEIYCDQWTKKHALALADGEQVVYSGFAPKPRNYELMRSADLLALPATFSDTLGFYRFSMPTKLPEYLASGTPVLAYGPRGTASIELCLRHELGHVLTERSVPDLIELLTDLVKNREEHRRRAAVVREFTREKFSASAACRTFHGLIERALQPAASAR